MDIFQFDLLVEGFDVEDDTHIEALLTCDLEAYPSTDGARTIITFLVPAPSSWHALQDAVDALEPCVSGAEVDRVAADLVNTSDIARRVGVSREYVRQLAAGTKGPGGFPVAEAVVGGGVRVWHWYDVHRWMVDQYLLAADLPRPISPDVAIGFRLAHQLAKHLATSLQKLKPARRLSDDMLWPATRPRPPLPAPAPTPLTGPMAEPWRGIGEDTVALAG